MKQPSQMPEAAALSGLCPYAEFAVVSEGTCAGTQAGAEGGKRHLRERALALALVAAAAVGPAGSSVDVGWVDEVLGHRHFQALVDHVAQLRRHTQQSHTQQPHTRDGPKRPTPSSAPVWSPTQKRARDDAKAERSHGRGTVGLHAGLLEANEAVKHVTNESDMLRTELAEANELVERFACESIKFRSEVAEVRQQGAEAEAGLLVELCCENQELRKERVAERAVLSQELSTETQKLDDLSKGLCLELHDRDARTTAPVVLKAPPSRGSVASAMREMQPKTAVEDKQVLKLVEECLEAVKCGKAASMQDFNFTQGANMLLGNKSKSSSRRARALAGKAWAVASTRMEECAPAEKVKRGFTTFEKTRIDSCIQAMKGMVKSTKAGEREWMAKWAVPPGHYGGARRFLRWELEERLDFSLEELEDVPQGAAVSNRQTNSSIKEKVEASNCLQSLANCQLADHYWIFKLLGKRRSDLEELRKHFLMIEAIGASRCTAHGREGLGATEHVSFTTKLQEGSSSVPMRFVSP